jgi:DNA-binding transcriptional LysR family regulator
MDYDPNLLRSFVAVKETGGFTRAGERLHLSQSAISHQIRKLEEQAGTALLIRTTRSLTLTEDGEDFLCHARHILRAHDAMARRFQRSSVVGVVRFGIPENYLGDRLPSLLAKFSRMFPTVRLDVTVDNYLTLRDQINADALDLAVTLSLENDKEEGLLRKTQFVWAAAEVFDMPEHGPLPVAFAPSPCLHRQIGLGALEDAKVAWRMAFTSPSQQGLRAAVQAGLAVTVLPLENLETGMVVLNGRYGLPSLPQASFRLLWNASGKTPAAMELAQLLAEMPDAS